jgi:DNA mismatch endonuclease (patch repair protein)
MASSSKSTPKGNERRRLDHRKAPSYAGCASASTRASNAARATSLQTGTKCELLLRRSLWKRGLRYRVDCDDLPGRPDIVFRGARVAVFCDGDFWHGRNGRAKERRLERGHNSAYWVAKIRANVARDKRQTQALRKAGWLVLRYWESDIKSGVEEIGSQIINAVVGRELEQSPRMKNRAR